MKNYREKRLIKNTIVITIGKVSTQLINFLLLPFYTALLSTEEYGTVDFINTIVFLLAPIVTFQIDQGLFRFLIDSRKNKEKMREVISSALFSLGLQLFIFGGIFIFYTKLFWGINNKYIFLYVISYVLSSFMLQLARGLGDNFAFAVSSTLTAGAIVIGNVLFIGIFNMGASGMLISSILSYVIGTLYLVIKLHLFRYIQGSLIQLVIIKKMLSYSIPLIPNAISWWIFNASDRFIVNVFLGVEQNGILAIAHKFPQIYVALFSIFNISWTESASEHIKDRDAGEYFSSVINTCMKIFSSLCLIIIAIMPFVFDFFVNKKFNEAYYHIPMLMIGSLGNVGIGVVSVIYIALKDTKSIARTSIFSALINCFMHLLLINYIGLYAASISTLIAFYVMLIYRCIDIKKKININFDKKSIIATALCILLVCASYYSNYFWVHLIVLLCIIIHSYISNINAIYLVKNYILAKFIRK